MYSMVCPLDNVNISIHSPDGAKECLSVFYKGTDRHVPTNSTEAIQHAYACGILKGISATAASESVTLAFNEDGKITSVKTYNLYETLLQWLLKDAIERYPKKAKKLKKVVVTEELEDEPLTEQEQDDLNKAESIANEEIRMMNSEDMVE